MSIRIDMNKFLTFEVQNPNLWEFFIAYAPDIRYRVRSCSLPFIGFDTENQYHYHYPSERTLIEDVSISFLEDTSFTMLKYFRAWRNEIYDENRKVFKIIPTGKQDNGKRNGILIYQKFQDVSVPYPVLGRQYRLLGMFPKKVETIENTYDNTDPFLVTLNFSVDDVKLDMEV